MNLLINYVLPWRKKRAADSRPQGVLFKIGNEERYAASELASLRNEIIRPVIEEHVRDSQDDVATTVAEKWMQKTVEQAQPAEEPGNDDEVSCPARILNMSAQFPRNPRKFVPLHGHILSNFVSNFLIY
ncbi:hypothetical protein D5086_026581 [Populus alba]|uniref:Uncharacterized protein n=2 Tax=Populus TaxID=3689 RepID=A0ACC4B3S2_POPAL|nr:hypothetical protein NC653_005670 [Populus alba x Populus x berolinensis]